MYRCAEMPHVCPSIIQEALGSSMTTLCLVKYQELGGINPTQGGLEPCPGSERVIQQSKEMNQKIASPRPLPRDGPKAFLTPLVRHIKLNSGTLWPK